MTDAAPFFVIFFVVGGVLGLAEVPEKEYIDGGPGNDHGLMWRYARVRFGFLRLSILLLCCLITLVFSPILVLAETEPAPIDTTAVDEFVRGEMERAGIPGLALGIVHGDQVVYLQGYGTSNSRGDAVTQSTPFVIGSVGKTFTALAIRQLANQGIIDIDQPVSLVIPWFSVTDEAGQQMTIRHLIDQTSGFSTSSGVEGYTYNADYSLEELVKTINTRVKVNKSIGSSFEYSNLNFVVLGLVVEYASGQSYEDYVTANVFQPLDMLTTFASESKAQEHGLATGYRILQGYPLPTHVPYPTGQMPSGYQISTAGDMSKYLIAYLNRGYYQDKSALPGNPLVPGEDPLAVFDPEETYYDISWGLTHGYAKGNYNYFYGWVGSTPNFNSVLLVSQEHNFGIVVLANCSDPYSSHHITAQTIGNGITDLLLGKTPWRPTETSVADPTAKVILIAVLLVAASLASLITFRKRISRAGVGRKISLASLVVVNFALPVLFYLGVPAAYGNSWAFFLGSSPEYFAPAMLVVVAWLLFGAAKLFVFRSARAKRQLSS